MTEKKRRQLPDPIRDVLQLYHWSIWITLLGGICLLGIAYLVFEEGTLWHNLMASLGSLVLSVAVVGLLLNALWWRSWAVKAIAELFSNRELVEKLNLKEEELHARLYVMAGAVYGAKVASKRFKEAIDRDLFQRLEFPIKEDVEISYDLKLEELPGLHGLCEIARVDRVVRYKLKNYYRKAAVPFMDQLVLSGFVDVPDSILTDWMKELQKQGVNTNSKEASAALRELNNRVEIFRFESLSFFGDLLKPEDDYYIDLGFDGSKPEPDITFEVRLKEDTAQKFTLEPDDELHVVYAFSCCHNLYSYIFTIMSQPTEGGVFHFRWDESVFKGVLRYIFPPYWGDADRELVGIGDRQRVLFVNAMLLPGHAVLASWRPKDTDRGMGKWRPAPNQIVAESSISEEHLEHSPQEETTSHEDGTDADEMKNSVESV